MTIVLVDAKGRVLSRNKTQARENPGKVKEKEEKKKSKTPFDFWTLFDKREVYIELVDGQRFHGTLRANLAQRYDVLLHVKNNERISTLLIRKDVIKLLESDEEIFPVLKKG